MYQDNQRRSNEANALSAFQTGMQCLERGDLSMASQAFRAAIGLAPSMAAAHLGLGNSLRRQRESHAAEAALRQAIKLDPALREASFSLSFLLHGAGRDAEAVTALTELAAGEPTDLTLQRQVAGLLIDFGCFAQAEPIARKIAETAPAAGAWQRVGFCRLRLQRLAEAEEAFDRALHSDPLAGSAYLLMSQTRRATEADRARLVQYQAVLDSGRIVGENRASLHFALGNWLEDLGDYAGAWEQFSAGNRLYHSERPFDRAAWEDYFRRILATTVQTDHNAPAGPSPQPLFLVGLPGSNPEPLASMLGGHPAICSLEGSLQMDGLARACEQLTDATYPDCLAKVEPAQLDGLAQSMRGDWKEKARVSAWVLDESALNFLHLALILRVFPGSRIICQRRDPLDDCLSAYLCPFPQPIHNHAHDLQNLAFFYRQFTTVMDHWRTSLPTTTLLTLHASAAPAEASAAAAATWKFLDLEPPTPVEPEQSVSHLVLVPDPMQREIPGRWRHYREHLGPLLEIANPESE